MLTANTSLSAFSSEYNNSLFTNFSSGRGNGSHNFKLGRGAESLVGSALDSNFNSTNSYNIEFQIDGLDTQTQNEIREFYYNGGPTELVEAYIESLETCCPNAFGGGIVSLMIPPTFIDPVVIGIINYPEASLEVFRIV